MDEGRYLYCIIEENEPKTFGPLGIGGRGDELVTVPCDGLACVVSSSPITNYRIMREYTMAHYRAIEKVMEDYAVLPIRFSTIAESDQEIIEQVLRPRRDEFQRLLHWISGKESVEVRASFTNMDAVFQELLQAESITSGDQSHCRGEARSRCLLRPHRDRQGRSGDGQREAQGHGRTDPRGAEALRLRAPR